MHSAVAAILSLLLTPVVGCLEPGSGASGAASLSHPATQEPGPAEDLASTSLGRRSSPGGAEPRSEKASMRSADPEPPAPGCASTGDVCETNDECCSGACTLSCNFAYGVGQCIQQRADGEACDGDIFCLGGRCVDGVCGRPRGCLADSEGCQTSGDCCSGICTSLVYGLGSCIPPQVEGAWCQDHEWCLSGVCSGGVCGGGCAALGGQCFEHGECCTGLCTWMPDQYGWGSCITPQPDGSFCQDHSWCESGACRDNLCVQPRCDESGSACWFDANCCTGFCSYNPQSPYQPGFCSDKQPAGAVCWGDSGCASGACEDSTCL